MDFDSLINKRLLIVAGKGGVGRTTITASVAFECAMRGKKILLVSIESSGALNKLMQSFMHMHRHNNADNLAWINLDRQESLNEYISQTVKLKTLAEKIISNPIYEYLTAVAPGVRELVILNLIYEYERETLPFQNRKKKYDIVIVDGPATGHGLSFLEVPQAVLKTIKVGPLKARAQRIKELLQNTEKTGVILVTLAEELPVTEAIEFYTKARESLKMDVDVLVVNAVYPQILPDFQTPVCMQRILQEARFSSFLKGNYPDLFAIKMGEHIRFSNQRYQLNQSYIKKLHEEIGIHIIKVPFFPIPDLSVTLCDACRKVLFNKPATSDSD